MMRERFDRIEIIDLRGDLRRGERAGVEGDQGVFNIMVGTSITIAIADGSRAEGEAAEVHYQDCWTEGLFSRKSKLEWLDEGSLFGPAENRLQVPRQRLVPDPEMVRLRLKTLLEKARSAEKMPWSERDARMWQTVFPNMAKWLPEEEAGQLCFEFAEEMKRLSKAA